LTKDGLTNTCKKYISNDIENVPFGDLKYGLLGSAPAEMLQVSGTGLLKHIFGCLDNLIGGPKTKKDKESIDDLHRCLVRDAEQQSERDFPRMSIWNRITDGTKMCGSKQVGKCFVLLCVMHTHSGQTLMWTEMKDRTISLKKIQKMPETVLII
jgi:hypothetical protein